MTLRDDLHRQIDELSEAQLGDASSLLDAVRAQESASQVLARARDPELDVWQRAMIHEAVTYADSPNAEWIPHEDLVAWLRSWGTDHELPPPPSNPNR
jgi:predicted transcriptional regulator